MARYEHRDICSDCKHEVSTSFPCNFIGQWQQDPKWKDEGIGDTPYKIGAYGCLISAISSLGYWACDDKNPSWCSDNFSFTSNGSLYWDSVTDADINMDFVYRYYGDDPVKIKEILESELNTVVIEVPAFGARHWLAGLSYSSTKGYLVYDPWMDDTIYLLDRYPYVSGYAEFKSKK